MKIALINGSPKIKGSASGALLEDLKCIISENAEFLEVGLHKAAVPEDMVNKLTASDAWVIACPLYFDGIPGHLLSCLMQLEKAAPSGHTVHIYGIVNCGFYEGIQAEFALEIFKNWCGKAGYVWGGGIGIGGAGALSMTPKMEPGKGPKAPIDNALSAMAGKILRREAQENTYVSVAMPRFLYKMGAQIGWRQLIKANGGKAKDLGKRPE